MNRILSTVFLTTITSTGTFCSLMAGNSLAEKKSHPNVILLLTDDQGYGDIAAHGNPVLKTPEINKLWQQSVRFTDFHVAPMCSPTRGQLMTGMDAMRNGATAVCQGRSMVRNDIKIMPQFFAESGYATGMFGKWHLGDSYPYLPNFRGFQETISFRAWGITSLADYWGNSYFNPVLMHNGVDTKFNGYSTDIFFNEAMKWIEKCTAEKKPFFAYIPTNTPHVPEEVAKKYSDLYQGTFLDKPIPGEFYGMIANIDENIGKLEAFLKEKRLRDNTILIFMSDNGTQKGEAQAIFNAGMRDRKTSVYEGGHRVPLFVRWIDGKLQHGSDISELTQVQDLLPTLIELCNLNTGQNKFDGTSLVGLLTGNQKKLTDRMCVVQYRVSGAKWDPAVVMWDKWRLVNGEELFNITNDPGQQKNVNGSFPEVTRKMNTHYDDWYKKVKPEYDRDREIVVGSNEANPVKLYANDWQGDYCDNQKGLLSANGKGYWNVIIAQDGQYEIELRRWPEESGKKLTEPFDATQSMQKSARPIAKAELQIQDFSQSIETKPEDKAARFVVQLKAGKTKLATNLFDKEGKLLTSAMYVKMKRIN
jgi:arylsulfatase